MQEVCILPKSRKIYLFRWMIDTVANSDIKLIETFAHASLIVGHDLINNFIFHSFVFQKLARSQQSVSANCTECEMFSSIVLFFLRLCCLFLSESHKFLTASKTLMLFFVFVLLELSQLKFISRGSQSFREL